MAYRIPTTQELTDNNLAKYESELGQKAPISQRAFLRVLAAIEAALATGNYKLIAERILQNLALTATEKDLLKLGENYGVNYKYATNTVLDLIIYVSGPGVTINVTNAFIGDLNGIRYFPETQVISFDYWMIVRVTAETAGTIGNLNIGDTLQIEQQVSGAATYATVDAIVTTAVDNEEIEIYRERVLDEIRTVGGGGNAVDYRRWSEQAPLCRRAFPYAGRPLELGDSLPGERTVFVEAVTSVDPDGIPTQEVLDQVRDYITTNPETGLARQPLGMTDDTLYVEPIIRTGIYVEIRGLQIGTGSEEQIKDDIESALDNYFRSIVPFVDGVDVVLDRNDTISNLTVSTTVQSVLLTSGSTAASIGFGVEQGSFLDEYMLGQGEMAKLESVSYV